MAKKQEEGKKDQAKKRFPDLFVEDLGKVVGGMIRNGDPSTMATHEEGGTDPTTAATNEEC